MGLQGLLDSIRASGEAQLQSVEEAADQRVRQIAAEVEAQVQEFRQRARQSATLTAGAERHMILHLARLEALHHLGAVREVLIDAALDQTRGQLRHIRKDESYPMVLRRLLEEALAEILRASNAVGIVNLKADRRDQALLTAMLAEMNLTLQVEYCLECWGGVIARSEDGRIVATNTLETRLERATPHLRQYLAAFFENNARLTEEDLPKKPIAQASQ